MTGNPMLDAIDAEAAHEAEEARRAQAALDEEAAVKDWLKRIEDALDFDKAAREGYAKDRTYCQATANSDVFDVRVPIAGTYVNILTTFLYARDPEASVELAEACGVRVKEDAKAFATTLEIVIGRVWKKARLKQAADPLVRSGLSVAIGWMKAAWHRETGNTPAMQQEIADMQAQVAAINHLERDLAQGETPDTGTKRAELEQRIASLEEQAQRIVFNGLFVDFVRAEDIQVAPECACLRDYASSPWIAHRIFMSLDEAKAEHPEVAEKLKSATTYFRAPPRTVTEGGGAFSGPGNAEKADEFTKALSGAPSGSRPFICKWEIWDKRTGHVITVAEGCNAYLRAPFKPEQRTTRFYPFFSWAPIWNDGQRHPQSLTDRSRSLLDEYDRTRTNYRTHRRRAIPKTGFDRSALGVEDANRLEDAVSNEMVGLNLNGQRPEQVIFPISYNQIDPALYDTSVIRQELELVWGIQEALSSSVRVAKTATEADIQQQGTESRMGYARDSLDEMLSDFAVYTGELAVSPNGLTDEDARTLAGEDALWIPMPDPALLDGLVQVNIRAGSSGKPATALRQQQWGVLLPQLQRTAIQIGQLRGASPLDIANCLEQLAVETVKRSGDTSIDPYNFIPQPPAPVAEDPMAAMGGPLLAPEGVPLDPEAMPVPAEMLPPPITPIQ